MDRDFKKLFPNKELTIEKNFDNFFTKLFELRQQKVRDAVSKELINKYVKARTENDQNLDGLRVLVLPHLVPPSSRFKLPTNSKKPSNIECCQGFVVFSKVYIKYILILRFNYASLTFFLDNFSYFNL